MNHMYDMLNALIDKEESMMDWKGDNFKYGLWVGKVMALQRALSSEFVIGDGKFLIDYDFADWERQVANATAARLAQQALGRYFVEKNRWRSEKAASQPQETRNERSAAALLRVTYHVAMLPLDSPLLLSLAHCKSLFDPIGNVFMAPHGDGNADSESDRMASNCGFDEPMESPAAWILEWAKVVACESGQSEWSLE